MTRPHGDPEPIAAVLERCWQACRCPDCGTEYDRPALTQHATADREPLVCGACQAIRDQRQREAAQEAAMETIRMERLDALAIPPAYADATFERWTSWAADRAQRDRQAAAKKRAWLAVEMWPGEGNLAEVWHGSPGTGKTHLAYAIARVLVTERLATCRVVKLPSLASQLRESWSDKTAPSWDAVLTTYTGLDWLAIDEVSAHATQRNPKADVYAVLDARLQAMRPTVLISNETAGTLRKFLGDAILSRVNASGGAVDFGTADYRSRAA